MSFPKLPNILLNPYKIMRKTHINLLFYVLNKPQISNKQNLRKD